MKQKIVYDISYFEEESFIDAMQIDELNEELIWDLYKEFGHERTIKTRFEVEEVFESD